MKRSKEMKHRNPHKNKFLKTTQKKKKTNPDLTSQSQTLNTLSHPPLTTNAFGRPHPRDALVILLSSILSPPAPPSPPCRWLSPRRHRYPLSPSSPSSPSESLKLPGASLPAATAGSPNATLNAAGRMCASDSPGITCIPSPLGTLLL